MEKCFKEKKEELQKNMREHPEHTRLVVKSGSSTAWNKFKIIYYENKLQDFASCNLCAELLSTKSGTKGMVNHTCHLPTTPTTQPEVPNFLTRKVPKDKIEKLNEDLAEKFSQDLTAFSAVGHRGFRNIATQLIKIGAKYGPKNVDDLFVDRRTLKKSYLPRVYGKAKTKFGEKCKFSNFAYFPSFTADIWKDKLVQNAYLGVTISFVDENFELNSASLCVRKVEKTESQTKESIQSQMEIVLQNFFPDFVDDLIKESYFVTDNGGNVKNIMTKWISCSCHNLNLVLQHVFGQDKLKQLGLFKLEQFLTSSKSLVEYFKRGGYNKELTIGLKQQSHIRWNSMYIMMKSIQTSYTEVKNFLKSKNMSSKLNGVEEKMLVQLIELLEPFKTASESLSASINQTIHKVALMGHQLKDHLFSFMGDGGAYEPEIKKAAGLLLDLLEEKYKIEHIHYVALMLNPK